MSKSRLFQVVVLVAIVALFACSQLAMAANKPHFQIKLVPRAHVDGIQPMVVAEPPTPGLYGVAQWFGGSPATSSANPVNTDGDELWPCFGGGTVANVDCPTIGDPVQAFPANGVVLGVPSLSWKLTDCDANTTANAFNYCGQTETWYEDWTPDTTDELTYLLTATQVQSGVVTYIADSGTVDFGPNPYGAACAPLGGCPPAADVIIYGDQDFGTQGMTGVNNGNCETAYDYPLASNTYPGVYVVPAGKTCKNPIAGLVTLTATTEIGTPAYTKVTKGTLYGVSCTIAAPCYTTKWTKKYSVAQKWIINLY
jgi:hypothetical protein